MFDNQCKENCAPKRCGWNCWIWKDLDTFDIKNFIEKIEKNNNE